MPETEAVKGYGTLFQRAIQACAILQTGTVPANNAILWTAVPEGTAGNSIRVALSNPGGTGTLSVSVSGNDITVTLARTGGVITSTAADVIAAIKAHSGASALVRASNYSTSNGTGLVVAVSLTYLAGGSDTVTYETVAEVLNISGPALNLTTIEVTNQSSTERWREYIATLLDGGEFSLDLNFLPAANSQGWILGMIKDVDCRKKRTYRIILSDSGTTTWDCSGYCTKFTPAEPVEGRISASVTIKTSSKPTLE